VGGSEWAQLEEILASLGLFADKSPTIDRIGKVRQILGSIPEDEAAAQAVELGALQLGPRGGEA
jgi:hypothetical protein